MKCRKFTDGQNVYFVGGGPDNNGRAAAENYEVYYYDLAHPASIKRYPGFCNMLTTKEKAYLKNLLFYAHVHDWKEYKYE